MVAESVVLGGRRHLVGGGVTELGDMRQVVEVHEGRGDAIVVGVAGCEATRRLTEIVARCPVGEKRTRR